MKKLYIFMAILAAALLTAGCNKNGTEPDEKDTLPEDIVGTWHLKSTTSASASVMDVWLSLGNDGAFSLWQKSGNEVVYDSFSGTYTLTDKVLSGRYSDGTSWGSSYDASVEGSTMTLASRNGADEISTYSRGSLPSGLPIRSVRSAGNAAAVPVL